MAWYDNLVNVTGDNGWGTAAVNWIEEGIDDLSGTNAAEIQSEAVKDQAAREEQQARDAQAFFAEQSAQGITDIMGGAQMGTQAIRDYGQLALGAQGQSADAALAAMQSGKAGLVNFQGDPGYQFRQQQGEDAINRAASARGGRLSGRTLEELADFNSGLASQEFGNFANREMGYAGNMANLYQGSGDRMASAFGGIGSQLGNIYSGLGGNLANVGIGVGANNMQATQNLAGAGRMGTSVAGMPEQAGSNFGREALGAGLTWLAS